MAAHPQVEHLRRERAMGTRMACVTMALIVGFTGISLRLYWLQVKMHKPLAAEAAKLRQDRIVLPALRGSIWDSSGELLAQDRTLTEIYADKKHLEDPKVVMPYLARIQGLTKTQFKAKNVPDAEVVTAYREHVAKMIAPLLGKTEAETFKQLSPGDLKSPILIQSLEKEDSETWRTLLKDNHITGIYPRAYVRRFNPAGDRLAHVLGTVNRERQSGVEGVEQLMNRTLKGADGYEYVERDSNRKRELPGFAGEVSEPQHGKGVVLTIDMHLQEQLEDILLRAYHQHNPNKIQAVLIEPTSGSILAMASQPLEQTNKEGSKERRNMAVTDLYEPGSTMKILTLSAGLDLRRVNLDTTFDCSPNKDDCYQEQNGLIKLRDDETNGKLTVKGILTHSSNIGAYKVAKTVTSEPFYEYITRFGFGSKTALSMPREQAGMVRPVEKWSATSLSRIAMGYEISVTPLQMAMAVGTIANKGVRMQPRLIDRLVDADGRTTEMLPPVAVCQVCTARTANWMTEALESVVTEGTGKQAAIEGVRVAGKTGTAQRCDPVTHHYIPGHYVVSFVGFAPADNPKVACVIVMDDPKAEDRKQLYGGKLAAPVFAEVVKKTLDYIAVAPDHTLKLSYAPQQDPQ